MVIVFIAINLLRVTFILYSGFHVFVKLEQAFYTVFSTIASCAETVNLLPVWKIQCKLPPKTKRFCPLVLK